MAAHEGAGRWRVSDGEEARLTPGAAAAAEVWSRGFLPLRVRSEGSYRLRPAFPGTAVVLGEGTYEVLSETELPEDGLVVYRLRPWPEGEVIRDRVVYGPAFVRAAERERERARVRERARPWRFLLYPLVGLLPEDEQERVCDRLGLYAVTATLVSGLVESAVMLALLLVASGASDGGRPSMLLTALPGLVLLVLPGLGRAFRRRVPARDRRVGPGRASLSRRCGRSARAGSVATGASSRSRESAFWERLGRPDAVEASPDGTLVFRGLLPHLTWDRLEAALGGIATSGASAPSRRRSTAAGSSTRIASCRSATRPRRASRAPLRRPPPPTRTRCWPRSGGSGTRSTRASPGSPRMLAADVQARAFDHRGGPAAARAADAGHRGRRRHPGPLRARASCPGRPAIPLAPFVGGLAVALVADAVRRVRATRRGRVRAEPLPFAAPLGARSAPSAWPTTPTATPSGRRFSLRTPADPHRQGIGRRSSDWSDLPGRDPGSWSGSVGPDRGLVGGDE